MQEKQFISESGQHKSAYELTRKEFGVLIANMRLFAHPAKTAIVLTNDSASGVRPRLAPVSEALDRLDEILRDETGAVIPTQESELDVLRYDRAEIASALHAPRHSGVQRNVGHVVLGLASMATVFNELRPAITAGSPNLIDSDQLTDMMHQFYDDGLQRIMDNTTSR